MERLDDLDDKLDDRGRGEKLSAFRALGHCKLPKEVFIDLPEDIAFNVDGNRGEVLEESKEQIVFESSIVSR